MGRMREIAQDAFEAEFIPKFFILCTLHRGHHSLTASLVLSNADRISKDLALTKLPGKSTSKNLESR